MTPFLAASLARLDSLIEREILRMRARYELSLDEFRGLYVSDEQVDRLVERRHASTEAADVPRGVRPSGGASDARWYHLATRFGLSPLEQDLLIIGTACDVDVRYETLFAYLNNDVTRKWPTVDLAARLLQDVASPADVMHHISSGGRLHARHLICLIESPAGRPSCLNRGFATHPCVVHWLHGHSSAVALSHPAIDWLDREALSGSSAAAFDAAEPIVRIVERCIEESRMLPAIALLRGAGCGRTAAATAAAHATVRPLVLIDRRRLGCQAQDVASALDCLAVGLTLEPAVVLIRGFEATDDAQPGGLQDLDLIHAISQWPESTAILLRADRADDCRSFAAARRVIPLRCGAASVHRLEVWRDALFNATVTLSEAEVRSLAGRYVLPTNKVWEALATARDLATMQGCEETDASGIAAAARLVSDQGLDALAAKVERACGWDDLVLPRQTLQRLREFAAAIRSRDTVYDQWGFTGHVSSGGGVKALFAGPSGTGKTMAAGVIAQELGLDLYKVDLATVISKYIGETEKNLERIFRGARASSAILFLDEAEALLGRRSEVKDSHDRYANIEVAYLLQKLEEHDGVVVLATNLRRNIDDAFNRRLQYIIDFPRPQEHEREQLWRKMFPPQAPLDARIDFAFLAKQFDLAGGDIRNVALEAAFLAASGEGVIGMPAIVRALARQLVKEGRTPTVTDFHQYHALLRAS